MADSRVKLAIENDIAVLTIDRPERRNALDGPMWTAIGECTIEAAKERPRALIVTGTGNHFCAGMDLKPDNPLAARILPAVMEKRNDQARSIIDELKGCLSHFRQFPAPVIAAIEGVCLGGGFEVALACDIRIASTEAKVGLPEVRIGMIPDVGGTSLLTRLVGPGRAALVIASGEAFCAQEAFTMGMIERVVQPGQAMAEAHALAQTIARGGPASVCAAIQAIRRIPGMSQEEAFVVETEAGIESLTSGEAIEGMLAFAEKRLPRW